MLRQLKQAAKKSKIYLNSSLESRMLRVARTIADLNKSVTVETAHVLEALSYREPTTFFSS